MKKYTQHTVFLIVTIGASLLPSALLNAQEVSREEFRALSQKVEALESALHSMRATKVEAFAAEAASALPMDRKDRESFIQEVVKAVQVQEEEADYPWMKADKWAQIEKGMAPEAVLLILGLPTLNEPSLHKRIDTVYTYEGRRVATGKKVKGIVRFYKGKVVEIERPEID